MGKSKPLFIVRKGNKTPIKKKTHDYETAVKFADRNKLNVYNSKNSNIYSGKNPKPEIYRVKKSKNNYKSQVLATKDFDKAKKAAKKYKYNVYDRNNSNVYSARDPVQKVYRVRKTPGGYRTQIYASTDLDKAKKVCDRHLGYSVYNYKGKQVHKSTKKEDPLKKWYDAMEKQFKWSIHQKYDWTTPTVATSKYRGTCITFVAVSLQRLGLIPKGTWFNANPSTGHLNGTAANYIKNHPNVFYYSYPNKTAQQLAKEGKIKKGDIVAYKQPGYHTMVYMGMKKNGRPIFNSMGHKRILSSYYRYYENRKISLIVRIKKI